MGYCRPFAESILDDTKYTYSIPPQKKPCKFFPYTEFFLWITYSVSVIASASGAGVSMSSGTGADTFGLK